MSETTKSLEDSILGGSTEQLSSNDIQQLLTSFDTVSATFVLTLITALKRQKVDPTDLLIQLVPYIQTRDYLIPLALTLRYNANPNEYVYLTDQKQNIHLLGYIYITLRDKTDPSV